MKVVFVPLLKNKLTDVLVWCDDQLLGFNVMKTKAGIDI